MNDFPLNINLIIPFKDNKGERLNLYKLDIERFKAEIDARVDFLRNELDLKIGNCAVTISARSDGNSKKYYWRFKSSERDRKYNRLQAKVLLDYIASMHPDIRLWLKEVEEELIYINANLKLIKGILDAIDQVIDERAQLLELIV